MAIQVREPKTRLRFINDLEIAATEVEALNFAPVPPSLAESEDPSAAVVAGSMVSFVGGVPLLQQQDVKNSTLLAQLAANAVADRENETKKWYDQYTEVLENIGWIIDGFSFARFESNDTTLRVDESFLQILRAVATDEEIGVLTASLSALEELESGDRQLTLFDSSSSTGPAGNFQLGTAGNDSNGNVVLTLGASRFNATQHRTRFLFFSYDNSSIELFFSAQKVILNEVIYTTVRQAIVDKLGDNAVRFVADLPIAI